MSVNFYDGVDYADAFLSRRTKRRLVNVTVIILLVLLATPLLSVDQVGGFLHAQAVERVDATFGPIFEQMLDGIGAAAVTTTTLAPSPGG